MRLDWVVSERITREINPEVAILWCIGDGCMPENREITWWNEG